MGVFQIQNKVFDRIFKGTSPKHEKKNVYIFLENKPNTNYIKNLKYIDCRNKLDKIYEQKINVMRIRNKLDWCKYVEKSSKFVLNLEKSRAAQSTIRNFTKDKKNLTYHKRINEDLFDF